MGYSVKGFQTGASGHKDSELAARNREVHHMPGDEGTCPQNEDSQGESHNSAVPQYLRGPGGLDPAVGTKDAIHRPGEEGSGDVGELRQGNASVPDGVSMGQFLQGEDVRKTRVMPASGNATPGMPGA